MRLAVAVLLVAALAGCGAKPLPVFPVTDAVAHAPDVPQALGVFVTATVTGGGRTVHIHAQADNRGEATYQVPAHCADGNGTPSGTTEPWSIVAAFANVADSSFAIYPAQGCQRVLVGTFGPGEHRTFDIDWNGSFYSSYYKRSVDLFAGPYKLNVVLELYAGDQSHAYPFVAVLPVQVLAHGQ